MNGSFVASADVAAHQEVACGDDDHFWFDDHRVRCRKCVGRTRGSVATKAMRRGPQRTDVPGTYKLLALNVSPCLKSPVSSPLRNQRTLCSEVPWVNESGTTRPCAWRCKRSSPTELAAPRASS